MRNSPIYAGSAFILTAATIFFSCNSDKVTIIPELETITVTDISKTSAKSGGNIISDGGGDITEKGVCWGTGQNPTELDSHSLEGPGNDMYESILTDLNPGTEYFVRAFAKNIAGTAYGDEKSFATLSESGSGQIIADHTIVNRYDEIPQYYIDLVKKMWFVVPGQSHSEGYRVGLTLLESLNSVYQVNVTESGTPEAYTTSHLRASRATWGDYYDWQGWVYLYGEGSWFTNSTALERTKAGITYCNTHNLEIAAIGFGWCWDALAGSSTTGIDPVYGCHWYGESGNGPEGNKPWGIDAEDYAQTGNSVSMDTYLNATQQYIDYCASNGYNTKVFFTTGPVDGFYGESGYQGYLKYEHIRDYVKKDPSRILFDFADILSYDDNGTKATATWNGHTYPVITPTNLSPTEGFHFSNAGALRLAKAAWWMLARIAGWDGS